MTPHRFLNSKGRSNQLPCDADLRHHQEHAKGKCKASHRERNSQGSYSLPLKLVAFDVGHTLIDERIDASSFVAPVQLMPGVTDVLPQIQLPMAAWSNTKSASEAEVKRLLAAANIGHFFSWVVTSVDAGCRKPDRNFFRFALQQCGVSPGEVLFVGNQMNTDVCGGVQSGIRTVWIWGEAYRSPDDTVGNHSPDFVIDSLTELPELIKCLQP